MRVKNHKDFALFDYVSQDIRVFKLGDIVINKDNEIGVIIQIQGNDDYRTDMFGNCHYSEIRKATKKQVIKHKPDLIEHLK